MRAGIALDERLLIGVNASALAFDLYRNDNEDSALTRIAAELTYYPRLGGVDLFVRGAAGGLRRRLQDTSDYGPALGIGVGIEHRFGRRLALGFGVDSQVARVDGDAVAWWEAAFQLTGYL